jgi:hypothetical protein
MGMPKARGSKKESVKAQPALRPKDLLFPVWYTLPPRFFRLLNELANEYSQPAARILQDALKTYKSVKDKQKKGPESGDYARFVVQSRWAKTSAKERREVGRMLSRARWGTKEAKEQK